VASWSRAALVAARSASQGRSLPPSLSGDSSNHTVFPLRRRRSSRTSPAGHGTSGSTI